MKILIILFLVAASICTKSFGQVKEIMISRCEKSHVTISEIDIITSPLPQDEEGKTVSQIKSGFTTIYICNKPGIIDTNYSLKIDKLFDGEKKPLEAAGKSEKTGRPPKLWVETGGLIAAKRRKPLESCPQQADSRMGL